jgi:hypothetical protein
VLNVCIVNYADSKLFVKYSARACGISAYARGNSTCDIMTHAQMQYAPYAHA